MAFDQIEQVQERAIRLRERGVIDGNQAAHVQQLLADARHSRSQGTRKFAAEKLASATYFLDLAEWRE